jgi:uncharacterized protein (DUF488 family)
MNTPELWTIGHSNYMMEVFLGLLKSHEIQVLADVRRYPGSRRLPQFASDALSASLADADIAYHWIPALGGRRRGTIESVNTGWRHAAFRGYADHIATEEFAEGLFELLMLSEAMPTVIMCAEVLWWRCHRRIISDVLVSLGIDVVHIRDAMNAEPHRLRPPARVWRGRLTYPAGLSS